MDPSSALWLHLSAVVILLASSAPPAPFNLTATEGESAVHLTWNVSNPTAQDDPVADGGFEGGVYNNAWDQRSSETLGPIFHRNESQGVFTGDYSCGFYTRAAVEQTVQLPDEGPGCVTLIFHLWNPRSSGNGQDCLKAFIDGEQVFSVSEGDSRYRGWFTRVGVEIPDPKTDGAAHTLRFASTIAGDTRFFLDDVSIDVCSSGPPSSGRFRVYRSEVPAAATIVCRARTSSSKTSCITTMRPAIS